MKTTKAIYRLRRGRCFARIIRDPDRDAAEFTIFDGSSKRQSWITPVVQVATNNRPVPDISLFFGPAALIMSQRASEQLKGFAFWGDVEELPIICESASLVAWNILNNVDCNFNAGMGRLRVSLKTLPPYPFHLNVFRAGGLFVFEDASSAIKFKTVLASLGLKGLDVEYIWTGAEDSNIAEIEFDSLRGMNNRRQRVASNPHSSASSTHMLTLNLFESDERSSAGVKISWNSLSGKHSYIIQWSKDGNTFFAVDSIVAESTNVKLPITYRDTLSPAGRSFYRIYVPNFHSRGVHLFSNNVEVTG